MKYANAVVAFVKKHWKILVPSAALVLLSACTSTQLASFQGYVNNFIEGVHSVDTAVASVSATIYKNCGQIQSVGLSVQALPKTCSKAGLALTAINASIDSYCQAAQVTNIQTGIQASAAAYSAAKTAYNDAKASCAK